MSRITGTGLYLSEDFSQDLKEFEGELEEIYSRLELAGIKPHPCH
jgi:hypothetical protein